MAAALNFFPATVMTPTGTYVGRVYVNEAGRAIVYTDQGHGAEIGIEGHGATLEGVSAHSAGVIRLDDGTEWHVSPGGVGGCGCSHAAKAYDPAIYGEDPAPVGV